VNSPSQIDAYVSSAVGGSLTQISFGDNVLRTPIATTLSRGIRGRVKGFSRASRRSLLRKLATINRTDFRAYTGRLTSITLTYPSEYPKDPEVCKRYVRGI
jgi:hypothetical protein